MIDRSQLRERLLAAYPWLASIELGPANVDAGTCDRCGAEPRMTATCGPDWTALGRRCAADIGSEAWCEGHTDDAASALAWLARLPDEADDVCWLWWYATGEVRLPAGSPSLALLGRPLP